jgi:hypothetical protein
MEPRDIAYVIDAHAHYPVKPKKAFRQWDRKTPYSLHPIWCAATIETETTLPEELRRQGSQALLYHDVLEDTTQPIPPWIDTPTKELIHGMTFYGGLQEELEKVWQRSTEVILLKLYDKVSNLLDGTWMKDRAGNYEAVYHGYTWNLLEATEDYYSGLNITRMARGVLSERK